MIIEFERACQKKIRHEIVSVLWFAKSQLLPRIRRPLVINIKPVRGLAEKSGVYGDCMDEDDGEFTIRIDTTLSTELIVSTILHEMVHVQQYFTGKLKRKWTNEVTYKKVVYKYDMNYDDRPWEIEAWEKEQQLKDLYYADKRN